MKLPVLESIIDGSWEYKIHQLKVKRGKFDVTLPFGWDGNWFWGVFPQPNDFRYHLSDIVIDKCGNYIYWYLLMIVQRRSIR